MPAPPTLFIFIFIFFLLTLTVTGLPTFREAPAFRNNDECSPTPSPIHISMTLDTTSYLRGSIAAVFSILQHSTCPESTFFHFLASTSSISSLHNTISSTFPSLLFNIYSFNTTIVTPKISSSLRKALDQPLNYARIYLSDLLPNTVPRVIYLDSDVILVHDIARLWSIPLKNHVLGAPQYCLANFTSYFTPSFWSNAHLSRVFRSGSRRHRPPCYFNTGVMVIDLRRWRKGRFTARLERWMEIQKRHRIYELGSLPPFLLVFAGSVESVEHRWNQHGLGGDNLQGQCRDLHPGAVSLLHWSGKGKPWMRIDEERACPLDSLWAPYDLVFRPSFLPALHT